MTDRPPRAGARFRTRASRSWRGIRIRMIGVLLVPTLAAATLGVLQVRDAVIESAQAARAATIASALPDSFALALQLVTEREALYAGVPQKTAASVTNTTDDLLGAWMEKQPAIESDRGLRSDVAAITSSLTGIADLRARIADPATRDQARSDYTLTLNRLFGLGQKLPAVGDVSIYDQARALSEIRSSTEAVGTMRLVVGRAIAARQLTAADRVTLAQAETTYARNTAHFGSLTDPRALAEYDASNGATTTQGGLGAPMMQTVSTLVETGTLPASLTLESWQAITRDFVAKVGPAILTSAVALEAEVRRLHYARQEQAVATGSLIGMMILLSLLLAVLAGRSITGPLRRLRDSALHLAETGLPKQVEALERSGGTSAGPQRQEPFRPRRRDEIAEVATAFDAVHAEALRLAGEQARLRTHVNTMFVNLARRSRGLVERQLRLIDELEATEQDPDQLANLFRLDHLATRMRRNDESLLVLAGGAAGQGAGEDAAVLDVMRAAASEIEQYHRVVVDSPETALVVGAQAADLVHALAELAENATAFSPPDTPVTVHSGHRAPGQPLRIQVSDLGVGMTARHLAEANARLQSTSILDSDVARRMGLVVAARLAARHGWTISLEANLPRGLAATITVPAGALVDSRPVAAKPAAQISAQVSAAVAPVPPLVRHNLVTDVPATPLGALPPTPLGDGALDAATTARRHDVPAPRSAVPAPRPAPVDALSAPLSMPADDPMDSPIFTSLHSQWFSPLTTPVWTSPADAGWRRAAEVEEHRSELPATSSGLPQRIPGRHLLPGTIDDDPAAPTAAPRLASVPTPRGTRSLASFQQGVRRARDPHDAAELEESSGRSTT